MPNASSGPTRRVSGIESLAGPLRRLPGPQSRPSGLASAESGWRGPLPGPNGTGASGPPGRSAPASICTAAQSIHGLMEAAGQVITARARSLSGRPGGRRAAWPGPAPANVAAAGAGVGPRGRSRRRTAPTGRKGGCDLCFGCARCRTTAKSAPNVTKLTQVGHRPGAAASRSGESAEGLTPSPPARVPPARTPRQPGPPGRVAGAAAAAWPGPAPDCPDRPQTLGAIWALGALDVVQQPKVHPTSPNSPKLGTARVWPPAGPARAPRV